VFLCLAPAKAAQPFEQKGRLCAPVAEMSVLSGALAAGGYLDRPAQDASVAVRRYRGDLRLQNAALGIDVTASFSSGAQSDACKIFPKIKSSRRPERSRLPSSHRSHRSYGIERPSLPSMART
jgi:hypothetical protein